MKANPLSIFLRHFRRPSDPMDFPEQNCRSRVEWNKHLGNQNKIQEPILQNNQIFLVILQLLASAFVTDTVKPVYNGHPRDPKIVVVVNKWSLFRSHLCNKKSKLDPAMVFVVCRWSLFGGGR